jgi:hypothetical protein
MGLFDGKAPFDINGDGKMSASEKAARDSYYLQMLSEMGNEKSEGFNEKQEFVQRLLDANLDIKELEWMDKETRDNALRDAEIDPNEWEMYMF